MGAKRKKKPFATGVPFPKGVSGNPGGRPKIPLEVREAFAAKTIEAVEKLWEICSDVTDRRVQLSALMTWLDRSLGRVKDAEEEDPAKAPDDEVVEKAREALRLIDGGKK